MPIGTPAYIYINFCRYCSVFFIDLISNIMVERIASLNNYGDRAVFS